MQETMLGAYGPWAASIGGDQIPALSFCNDNWSNLETWRSLARQRALDCLALPDSGGLPPVTIQRQYTYDGLSAEELTWQLPYGPPTRAVLLKPAGVSGKLPGVLALHDHGGNKYLGKRKITRTASELHPMAATHQEKSYGGAAWANELAKRGYVVLAHDAFTLL